MVQCDTCLVWQHGLCVGFDEEQQLDGRDYFCELCRPDLHTEPRKRPTKKITGRQPSASNTAGGRGQSRNSRSHSPTLARQQLSVITAGPNTKRRNTMNSRDAAFDESVMALIEATAVEAAGGKPVTTPLDAVPEDEPRSAGAQSKKRRRGDDDP